MTKQEDSTSTDNISRIIDAELSEISNNIESFYWVPLIKTPFEPLNRVCNDIDTECKALAISFKSFTANLEAAEKMLLLPYMLVSQRAVDKAIETRGLKIIEHYGDS